MMMMAYSVFPFPSFVENAGECMVLDNEASDDVKLIFKRMKLLISWSVVVLLFKYRLFSILQLLL
ncbi:hypothetical protein Hanom_Chr01g00076341 [Helianthus anomalus]